MASQPVVPILAEAIAILERTPRALRALLSDLPDAWTTVDEGPDTFTALDVVGHLIDGERQDWIVRARTILEHGTGQAFEPFDRFAFRTHHRDLDLEQRLALFERERATCLEDLAALALEPEDLDRRGMHPELGEVTLGELLATWVTHDLTHIAQIARVMARRYGNAVGPWKQYLSILGD